jgi:peptidoglycan hydrolase-like protein with peptidoglycan-binding domain
MQCTRTARAAWCAGVLMALVLIMPAAPAAAETGRERASGRLLIPSAGWHGRPIQQPTRDAARPVRADGAPRGWAAGPVSLGTGTHRASGSQRVREVQWRLQALGYRPGPIDGIFGVRTRAAVAWFQVKHGFPVDGRASFAVVRHLRDRTTPGGARPDERRIEAPAPPAAEEPSRPTSVVVRSEESGTPLWAVVGLLLLAFAVGFAAVAMRQRKRQGRSGTRGIGYVRVGPEPSRRLEAHASSIEARCADHGIALAGLVTDDASDRDRPGLAFAFEQLEQGAADCLVVGRVGHLTRSPAELTVLLDRMSERETPLVVLNAEPAAPSGRWAREGHAVSGGQRDG